MLRWRVELVIVRPLWPSCKSGGWQEADFQSLIRRVHSTAFSVLEPFKWDLGENPASPWGLDDGGDAQPGKSPADQWVEDMNKSI